MNTYKTHYSNQVHQLYCSFSKHFYVTQNNIVKYQQKPMEITRNNANKYKKNFLIFYIIRDHFSNAFYSEIYTQQDAIPILDFIERAWKEKENYSFHGIPSQLMVPKSLIKILIWMPGFAKENNFIITTPESGFQAGNIIFKHLNDRMRLVFPEKNTSFLKERFFEFVIDLNTEKKQGFSNMDRWESNLKIPPRQFQFGVQ